MAILMLHHHPASLPCPVMCPVTMLRDEGELPKDAAHIYTDEGEA